MRTSCGAGSESLENSRVGRFRERGQGAMGLDREAELERKIGQMTLENDFLKKALQRLEEQRLLDNGGGGKRSMSRSRKK